MVEYKRRVALYNAKDYSPPKGINLQCWEFDDYTKIALTQLICNSQTPTISERRTMEDIDNELARCNVAYDRVRNRPSSLDGTQQRFECNLSELQGELDKLRNKSHNRTGEGFGDLLIG